MQNVQYFIQCRTNHAKNHVSTRLMSMSSASHKPMSKIMSIIHATRAWFQLRSIKIYRDNIQIINLHNPIVPSFDICGSVIWCGTVDVINCLESVHKVGCPHGLLCLAGDQSGDNRMEAGTRVNELSTRYS